MEYINSFEASNFASLNEPPMAHVSAVIGRHILLLGGYRLRLENDVRSITAFDRRDVLVFDSLSLQLSTLALSYDLTSLGSFPTDLLCSSGMASTTVNNRVYLFGGYSLSKMEAGNALYYIEINRHVKENLQVSENINGNEENLKTVKNNCVGNNSSRSNLTEINKETEKAANYGTHCKNTKNKCDKVSENKDNMKDMIETTNLLDIGKLCDEKIEGKLVFLGGTHDENREEDHLKYPSYRDKSSMVYWKKKLIVFGGYGCHFKKSESGEQNAHDFLGAHGDYVVGSGNRGWTNQLLVYSLESNCWTNPETSGPVPCPRAAHSAAISDNRMFIFGGRLGLRNTAATIRCNQLYHLDLGTMTWSQVILSDQTLVGRSWTSFTPLSKKDFFIVGGFSGENVPLADAYTISLDDTYLKGSVVTKTACFENAIWDPFMDERSWDCRSPLKDPLCRMWHSTCLVPDGRIYIFGGCQNNLIFEIERIQKTVERVRASPASLYSSCLWKLVMSRSVIPKHLLSNAIITDILRTTL